MTTAHENIDEAMLAVTAAVPILAKTGELSFGSNSKAVKTLTNDEILDKLKPILLEHGIVVYPRLVSRDDRVDLGGTPRTAGNSEKGILPVEADDSRQRPIRIRTILHYEFEFKHVATGTSVTLPIDGEALGNDDKGTRKASTSAQKQAYILAFNIVTGEPDPDTGANTAEDAAVPETPPAARRNRGQQMTDRAKTGATRSIRTDAKPVPEAPPAEEPTVTNAATGEVAEEPSEPEQPAVQAPEVEPEPAAPAAPAPAETPEIESGELNPVDAQKARIRGYVKELGFTPADTTAFGNEVTGKTERSEWLNTITLVTAVANAMQKKLIEEGAKTDAS